MLFSRYYCVDRILEKNFEDGLVFLKQMLAAKKEEQWFIQWVVQLPYMDKKNFVSFESYKEQVQGTNIDTRTTEEILQEVEEIERKLEEGGK